MQILDTISALLKGFDTAAIRYVHWKSNNNVDKALAGNDDLDVLVHPDDRAETEALLVGLGFIRGYSVKDQWQPNIYHYYCADPASGKLVHLHMHYALTLGYDFHKNFTLPLIDWYLEGRWNHRGIWLPQRGKEYILFVLRTLIKNARSVAWVEFPLRQLRSLRHRASPDLPGKSAKAEMAWLFDETSLGDIETALAASGLAISAKDFADLARAASGAAGKSALQKAAAAAKSLLADTKSTSEARSFGLALLRVNKGRIDTLLSKLKLKLSHHGKQPEHGGRIICFIGGDGAGKSTNVKATHKMLARHLKTTHVHIGRPKRSIKGTGYAVLGKLARLAGQKRLAFDLRNLALAENRLAAWHKACRLREAGTVVIMDRLPHERITQMDSPRIKNPAPGLQSRLAVKERGLYAQISGADLIIVLKLDPEIACQRRPEDDREELLERSGEIWRQTWDAAHMIELNTGEMSFKGVEQAVLSRVWRSLQTPFLRVEIVGTTGSGKSTLSRALAHELSNAHSVLPYKASKWRMLKSMAQTLPLTGFPTSTLALQKFKNTAQMLIFIDSVESGDFTEKKPACHFIIDQGPLFQIALAEQEGINLPKHLQDRLLAAFKKASGQALFLEAPVALLRERVLQRKSQVTRGSGMDDEAFSSLAQSYGLIYKRMSEDFPKAATIDASCAPEAVKQAAWLALNAGPSKK